VTELGPSNAEKALRLRERAKMKKPSFVRQESWKYFRLKENWRRPKGLDNKVRMRIKGWPPRVSAGYGGPKAARGLHPSGYEEVMIYNAEDLKRIDSKTQAARIAHTIGKRQRVKIITEARKKRITVLNAREVKETVEKDKELTAEEARKEEEEEKTAETTEAEKPKEKADRSKKKAGKQ
jgi:large subunit ribosomal protein L32e